VIRPGSRFRRNTRETSRHGIDSGEDRVAPRSGRDSGNNDNNNDRTTLYRCYYTNDGGDGSRCYHQKSLEELRVMRNRLESIRDLFDQARALVATRSSDESSSSSSSPSQAAGSSSKQQAKSRAMIENATSKYVLFRNRNLV